MAKKPIDYPGVQAVRPVQEAIAIVLPNGLVARVIHPPTTGQLLDEQHRVTGYVVTSEHSPTRAPWASHTNRRGTPICKH